MRVLAARGDPGLAGPDPGCPAPMGPIQSPASGRTSRALRRRSCRCTARVRPAGSPRALEPPAPAVLAQDPDMASRRAYEIEQNADRRGWDSSGLPPRRRKRGRSEPRGCWPGISPRSLSAGGPWDWPWPRLPGGAARAITGVLALSTYLLDYVARIGSPARWTGRFSPFRYYSALDIVVSGRFPPWSIVVLLVTSAAAAAIAYAAYRYRDL